MFHRLAQFGAIVFGLSAFVLLGCGGSDEPTDAPSKSVPPATGPAGNGSATSTGTAPAKAEAPASRSSGPTAPAAGTATDRQVSPESDQSDQADAVPGGAGRAVGKVLKKIMEDNDEPPRTEAPLFDDTKAE